MWHWLGRRKRGREKPRERRAPPSLVWFAGGLSGEAVHGTPYFELDGDILDTPAGGAPDWGSIFDANGDIVDLARGGEAAFLIADISPPGATVHTPFGGLAY